MFINQRPSQPLPRVLPLAAFAFAVLSTSPAKAQQARVTELDPIVVTGEVYTFGAQKIVHVTDEDLSRQQANDLHDIFANDPSIRVGGGIPAAEKIYIRGLEDKLLNLSIDGAPQGGYLSHHQGQYAIEPELLKYVQVEPGPGGATQGPGALGGSIRFVTKGPADFLEAGHNFGSFMKASYQSNADGLKLTSALYGRPSDQVGLLAAFTYFDASDYEDGNGQTVDYTAHTQKRAFVKGTTLFAGGHELGLSYENISDEGTFRHRPNFSGFFAHPVAPNIPVAMYFERNTVTLSYDQTPGNEHSGLSATTYYTDYQIKRAGQYKMGYESYGFDARHQSVLGANREHALTAGLDYRDDTLSFTGGGSITGFARTLFYNTIPDETVGIAGLYAQDNWTVNDRLQVSVGARIDNYKYEDKDGQSFDDTGFSPNLGVSYKVIEGLRLNASHGRAFRGVTIIDAITSNEGGVTNAPDIDPERAANTELGFQYVNGPFTFAGTVYRQKIKGVIVNGSLADPDFRGNGGTLEVDGYDLSVGFRQNGFDASLAVSESDPELNGANLVDVDFGLGSAYGRAWTAAFGYKIAPAHLRVGWNINYVEAYNDTPVGIPTKPSYVVHGVNLEWSPLPDRPLQFTVGVHNLFDKYYVDQATAGYNSQLARVAGLPEAGRDVRVSVSYRF